MNITTAFTCRSQECFMYTRNQIDLQSFVWSMVDFGGIGVRVPQELRPKDKTWTIAQPWPHEASLWPVRTWPTLLTLTYLLILHFFIEFNLLQSRVFANLPTCPDVTDPLCARPTAVGIICVVLVMTEFPGIPTLSIKDVLIQYL